MVRFAFGLLAVMMVVGSVPARPPHKQAVTQHLGEFIPAKLNACTLCHLPDTVGVEGKPHNPFGARLKAMGVELAKANRPSDIPSRFDAIAEEDSDGDGAPNLIEILTGHFPGDPSDKPTIEEISIAKRTLADYRRYQSRYPWRPYDSVNRPAVPIAKNSAWTKTPIDSFIAAEHEVRGLTPRPEAPRAALLRRVYLDLVGLAPTPEELHAFLNDTSSNAYEKVVDRLLVSPRYGERWGRHWMDVWRYSDWAGWTDGGQIRDSHPHIWRWRDWIIESLNADKGYDRMILEMLAGDELEPENPDVLRATGFLVRNYKMLSREKWMSDTVEHTFLAFQATTINCAKCHDHMYDPLMQKEYYQLRAVFEPHQVRIDRVPGEADPKKDGLPRVYDADLSVKTFLFIRGDDRTPDKEPLSPGIPAALGGKFASKSVDLPPNAIAPDKRDFITQEAIKSAVDAVARARRSHSLVHEKAKLVRRGFPIPRLLNEALRFLADESVALADVDLAIAEANHAGLLAIVEVEKLEALGKKNSDEWRASATKTVEAQRRARVAETHKAVLLTQSQRWNAKAKPMIDAAEANLAKAKKDFTAAEMNLKAPPSTAYTPRAIKTYPATSTGRRSALAHWLVDKNNPLTARVAVNHLWLRHFGQAIVSSVFDFGRNGRPPSNPALLDWLAAEFMNPSTPGAKPWSMKHLHKLMVTSAVYRQASTPDEKNLAIDRDNTFLWRMSPKRLEAELVRDNVLYVAGRLDLKMSGPDIDHNQGMTIFRRSLYFRHAAEKQMEFLKLFDAASVTECYQRKDSIVPQQALALANSELAVRMARLLARELHAKHADANAFVTTAFERILTRMPTSSELAECLAFLNEQEKLPYETRIGSDDADGKKPSTNPAIRAREGLIVVLMNHHEFVTVR